MIIINSVCDINNATGLPKDKYRTIDNRQLLYTRQKSINVTSKHLVQSYTYQHYSCKYKYIILRIIIICVCSISEWSYYYRYTGRPYQRVG